jgi:hypothetical protein
MRNGDLEHDEDWERESEAADERVLELVRRLREHVQLMEAGKAR